MEKDVFLQNITDKGIIQNHLTFMALYIALYENFTITFVEKVKSLLCDQSIQNGKLKYKESSLYQEKIKNRVVDDKGNKDILKATMLWLQNEGAMSEQDYSDFLEIKSIRNTYAHEMARLIVEGVPLDDFHWLIKLLGLYGKLDKWWINEIEIPISGEFLPGTFNEDEVETLILSVFKSVISSLYLSDEAHETKFNGEKQ